jgi:MYXO-CTERM domain-containing protein
VSFARMVDGRPTLIAREAIEVSSRARLAPWASTFWGATRMKQLAVEATKAGPASPMREEIVELSFRHEMTSPFTAFFAIPASEASRVQLQLADGRRRKRWLTADASDSVPMPGSAGMDAPNAKPVPAVERHSGGCAGCATSGSEGRGSLAGSILLLALVMATVRRRRG